MLALLLSYGRVPKDLLAPLYEAVRNLSADAFFELWSLSGRTAKVLKIAAGHSPHTDSDRAAHEIWADLVSDAEKMDSAVLSTQDATLKKFKVIGSDSYIPLDRYWSDAESAAAAVEEPERVIPAMLALLEWLEDDPLPPSLEGDIYAATAALATAHEIVFQTTADPGIFEQFFTKIAINDPNWVKRKAALDMLGSLRVVCGPIADALDHGLRDVSHVAESAALATQRLRRVEGAALDGLVALLNHPSAALAAAAADLISGLRQSGSGAIDYRRLVKALEGAVTRAKLPRPLYVMREPSPGVLKVEFAGLLDQLLYASYSRLVDATAN